MSLARELLSRQSRLRPRLRSRLRLRLQLMLGQSLLLLLNSVQRLELGSSLLLVQLSLILLKFEMRPLPLCF